MIKAVFWACACTAVVVARSVWNRYAPAYAINPYDSNKEWN